jgi:UTP:GlnB (protein PII) uridylyltransferase
MARPDQLSATCNRTCRSTARAYLSGAPAGLHRNPKFGPELLYVGAMFHDIGLTRTTVAPFRLV